jgi:hypothetical protein
MPVDIFALLGIGGGLFASFCGLAHCWPLVTPAPGYNSLLHVITAWALMPLGLLLAIRDGHRSGMVNAGSLMGSHFDAALDLVYQDPHFVIFMIWASMASLSFGGLYGYLGFLLCIARAATVLAFVKEKVDEIVAIIRTKLEERNIKIPGFTDPAASGGPKDE